jgi:hypothetical protein
VIADLTRRDLKLPPPPSLTGTDLSNWMGTKPDTVTTTVGGKTVTLTGEALGRWKYQRYMQDYLATIQSVDDNVGRLLGFLDRESLSKNTIVPRSRRSQHARPLWRANGDTQAHLFLDQGSVGAVRPAA